MTLEMRFWSKVSVRNMGECWPWEAATNGHNRGVFRLHGKQHLASRVAMYLRNGEMPSSDREVCHRCDNTLCVNPDHLYVGTRADNIRDAVERGRTTRGERHPCAKLRAQDVSRIRSLYSGGDVTLAALASEYGVHRSLIHQIVHRRIWAALDKEQL